MVGGYDFKVDQQDIGKIFAQEADRRKRNGLPLNMFKTIWDASGRLTTRSDAATRQAVYDEVCENRKRGRGPLPSDGGSQLLKAW